MTPFGKRTIFEEVTREVIGLIKQGEWQPGERLDGNDADALSRSSDLQLKPSKILASALTRSLDDNEQRIILVADGDIVDDAQILDIDGPAKLNSKVFHEFFRWLSGGLYPVRVERAEAPDRHINIEPRGFGLPKLILLVIIPGLALLVGGIHLARRQYS